MYSSISYKSPESPSLSDRSSQHQSWILSSYLSGIQISDDYISHVSNRYIDCSNTFEQQGELKILLNRPENRILQNVIWGWFLICSTVGTNFQVVYKTFIFIALPVAECVISAVLITDVPEILYVDRHPQTKKFGKQNIAVEPEEHSETDMGGGKAQTKKKTTKKIYNNLCSYTGAFKT